MTVTDTTAPAVDTTPVVTASPILVPTCGCGRAPVARFTTDADGVDVLACLVCFKELAPAGRVTHHVRGSHAECDHDSTPADRGRCRTARRNGEVYVGEGYGDDSDDEAVLPVVYGGRKGSKVHAADDEGNPICGGKLPANAVHDKVDTIEGVVDCARCHDAHELND